MVKPKFRSYKVFSSDDMPKYIRKIVLNLCADAFPETMDQCLVYWDPEFSWECPEFPFLAAQGKKVSSWLLKHGTNPKEMVIINLLR